MKVDTFLPSNAQICNSDIQDQQQEQQGQEASFEQCKRPMTRPGSRRSFRCRSEAKQLLRGAVGLEDSIEVAPRTATAMKQHFDLRRSAANSLGESVARDANNIAQQNHNRRNNFINRKLKSLMQPAKNSKKLSGGRGPQLLFNTSARLIPTSRQ